MKNNMNTLKQELQARQRVLLVGPPGCGKTARVESVARDCGYDLVVWRTSIMERVDVSGCIIPDSSAGVSRQLPLEDLHRLRNTDRNTVLFLDDLGQSPIDVQAALMRLFDSNFLPANVIIWGATNRPSDKAGVLGLCEPLRSRFDSSYAIPVLVRGKDSTQWEPMTQEDCGGILLGSWTEELESWLQWADSAGADAEVIAFHRFTHGRSLYNWTPAVDPSVRMPDYRSWGSVIRRWKAGLRSMEQVSSVLGRAVAADFLSFSRVGSTLPTWEEICRDPAGCPVPTEPSACWLMSVSIARAVDPSTASKFLIFVDRLPRMYGALAARDAYRRLGSKLATQPDWAKWFAKNSELFQ